MHARAHTQALTRAPQRREREPYREWTVVISFKVDEEKSEHDS